MNCDELLKALNDYVDGDVEAGDVEKGVCEEFAQHLAGCDPCQIVVDNIRGTIMLYKDGEPYPLPEGFHARLCSTLRDRWRAKFHC